MSRFGWMLTLVGLFAASGCDGEPADRTPGRVTSDDVRRDAGKAVDTAAEYSQQAKDEFQKKLAVRLEELDGEIAQLREKGRDLQDEARITWDRKIAELEVKRDAARVKLTEVGQSGEEAWKDLRKGAQSAWDELDKAIQEASREF